MKTCFLNTTTTHATQPKVELALCVCPRMFPSSRGPFHQQRWRHTCSPESISSGELALVALFAWSRYRLHICCGNLGTGHYRPVERGEINPTNDMTLVLLVRPKGYARECDVYFFFGCLSCDCHTSSTSLLFTLYLR